MTSAQPTRSRAIVEWWNGFWFAEVAPDIFAVLRILFGLVGGLGVIGLLNLPAFWSCTGIVASREGPVCHALNSVGLPWLYGYSILGFAALSFAALTLGYKSRIAAVCSYAAVTLIASWNDLPLSAAHQFLRALLFCLLWSDCGRVWSVDAWMSRGEGEGARVRIWPLRLIQIQVALMYLVTALWKLNNVMWRDGSALHYVFQNPQFPRFAWLSSPALDPWMTLATYATFAWEASFAFLILFPRTRRWVLAVGIVAHLGMWATLELGPFSWVVLASYVAFLDPEDVRRWLAAIASRMSMRALQVANVNR